MIYLRFRDLPKVGIKGADMRRQYIFLLLKVMTHSVVNAEIVRKSVGTRPSMSHTKGICTVVVALKTKGAILTMTALPRCTILLGKGG